MKKDSSSPLRIDRSFRGNWKEQYGLYFGSKKSLQERLIDLRLQARSIQSAIKYDELPPSPLQVAVLPIWKNSASDLFKTIVTDGSILSEKVLDSDLKVIDQYGDEPLLHSPYLFAAERCIRSHGLNDLVSSLRIVGFNYGCLHDRVYGTPISVVVSGSYDPEKALPDHLKVVGPTNLDEFPASRIHETHLLKNLPTVASFFYRE